MTTAKKKMIEQHQGDLFEEPAAEEPENTQEPGPPLFFFSQEPEATQERHREEWVSLDQYAPPDRVCYVCERRVWVWTGHGYQCRSGDPAHAERMRDIQHHPQGYYAYWGQRPGDR